MQLRGDLRRDVQFLGRVRYLEVMSDRIVRSADIYVLDGRERASVEVGGQILETSRPTLTGMAVGSVLPGSALLVGLAAPKKETKDSRTAVLCVAHPEWRIVEPFDPDQAGTVAGIAAQINVMAERGQHQEAMVLATAEQAPAAVQTEGATISDALAGMASLHAAGALTADEFATAKARILG